MTKIILSKIINSKFVLINLMTEIWSTKILLRTKNDNNSYTFILEIW